MTTHNLMRLMKEKLLISTCTFDLVMDVVPGQDKKRQVEVISQMKAWMDNMLDNSIWLPMQRQFDPKFLEPIHNTLVFCPDDPYDIVIQVLVHAKLNAIGQGLVMIERSHMVSDQGNGFGTWFDGDPDEMLPAQADWMGERCYFPQPWWHRSDASTIDIMAMPEDDIDQKPDILIDMKQLMDQDEPAGDDKAAEIIKPNFRPSIITND